MSTPGYEMPECVVEIGGISYAPIGVTVHSSRTTPIDRTEVLLEADAVDWATLQDSAMAVYLGYNGNVVRVFGGTVHLAVPENPLRVIGLDAVQRLKAATFTTAIVRPTLRDVLDTVFHQLGITDWSAASNDVQTRLFLARSISGTDVIQACKTSFDCADWDFYATPEGRFVFGPWSSSPRAQAAPVLALQHNVNIESLVPDLRGGRVTTSLAPWVLHGHRITIEDPEVSRATIMARVERVIHRFNAVDGGKTELQWTPV